MFKTITSPSPKKAWLEFYSMNSVKFIYSSYVLQMLCLLKLVSVVL